MEESIVNATPPSTTTTSLGLDPLQSNDLRNRSQLGLRNSATEHQEANNSESLSVLEKDLTELVESCFNELISRQVLMAEEGEDDGIAPNDALDMISEDEATANTGDENNVDHEARRARNRARAARRRRVNERIRSMHRELDAKFAAISERGFRTPVANIARVTAILECSNDPNLRQALRYAQRAWIQLDQQNPASIVRE
jgi:hypothetical protein